MYPREREESRAETGLRIEKERKGERTTREEEDGHGEVERRGGEWAAGNEGSYNRYSSGTRNEGELDGAGSKSCRSSGKSSRVASERSRKEDGVRSGLGFTPATG